MLSVLRVLPSHRTASLPCALLQASTAALIQLQCPAGRMWSSTETTCCAWLLSGATAAAGAGTCCACAGERPRCAAWAWRSSETLDDFVAHLSAPATDAAAKQLLRCTAAHCALSPLLPLLAHHAAPLLCPQGI